MGEITRVRNLNFEMLKYLQWGHVNYKEGILSREWEHLFPSIVCVLLNLSAPQFPKNKMKINLPILKGA